MKTDSPFYPFVTPIGAAIGTFFPLLLGYILGNTTFMMTGMLGTFAFLFFQRDRSIRYNLEAIGVHGLFLFTAFLIGSLTSHHLWATPYLLAFINGLCYYGTKIFPIPKPGHFFTLMVFISAAYMPHPIATHSLFIQSLPILYTVAFELVIAVLLSLVLRQPWAVPHEMTLFSARMVPPEKEQSVKINTIIFSFIAFVSAYTSFLLSKENGYWILISSIAVLLGEEFNTIYSRTKARIIGGSFGLVIGLLLMYLHPSLLVTILIMALFQFWIEYFVPRNYAIANLFIQPLVLLLYSIQSGAISWEIISYRFLGILVGSLLTASMCWVFAQLNAPSKKRNA